MNSTEIARVKRRFQKKHTKHSRSLFMILREDLRTSAHVIGVNTIHATDLPEGVHEVRIVLHPDRSKRKRDTRWLVTFYNKRLIGASKNYLKNLSKAGVIEFYLGKS